MPHDPTPGREPGARRGPLDDIVVLDLTRALAGPHAAMMLGDLGARVIKVETPGDRRRHPRLGTALRRADAGDHGSRRTSCRPTATRSRSPSTSRTPTTAEVLAALVRRADVLLENFRLGVLDRLGFTVERLHELNPRLVICSITGFGHDGPEGGRAGYDQIAQGEAGLMSVTGTEPADQGRRPDRATCWPACTARTACSPRCTSGTRPAAGRLSARRCSPRWSGSTPSRARAGPSAGEVPGAPGQPPPVDRALRAVPLRRRRGADRRRQRGPVARLCAAFDLDPHPGGAATPSGSPIGPT